MDYLKLQADAKSENRNLLGVFAFIIAIVATAAAAVVTLTGWATLSIFEMWIRDDAASVGREVAASELLVDRTPWGWVYGIVFVGVAATMAWVSRSREKALIDFGGSGIAASLGGRRIDDRSNDSAERRFVNAVQEMAIAARRPAPAVFVLQGEPGINCFNAGWTDETTAIGVTSGALDELERDELQAIAAQAMSHVFHGDARLNLRLSALVTGVAGLAMIGEDWIDSAKPDPSKYDDRSNPPLLVAGSLLYAVGYIGVWLSSMVQRSVARRHELLADATAIELLRQSEPMRDVLRRIGGHSAKSRIRHGRARSMNHLFMADAGGRRAGLHPDLRLRILRLDPAWKGEWLRPGADDHVISTSGVVGVVDEIPQAVDLMSNSGPLAPLTPAVDSVMDNPSLAPVMPVFDAMTAPIAGLGGSPAGHGLVAPMVAAAVFDPSRGQAAAAQPPSVDPARARAEIVALVHLATERTPTETSVLGVASVAEVTQLAGTLRNADRCLVIARAADALRGTDGVEAFAEAAVASLRVNSDLDQWMLHRMIIGSLVAPAEVKKHRSLERLRSDYAVVLSTLVAIGGGNTAVAFGVAVARADLIGTQQRGPGKLSALDKSLSKLAGLDPGDHERAMAGMAAAMHADGQSRRSELEFVEVVRLAITGVTVDALPAS